MPDLRAVSVDDPVARELLDEYVAYRRAGFRPAGGYRAAAPDPAAFTPPHGVFLVATDGDVVGGCGGIRVLDARTAEVKHLWTRDAVRGRGWGRALLTALEAEARRLGADRVVLDTNADLAAAQRLYRAAGYREIPPYNDNPNATHWFEKLLDGSAAAHGAGQ